MPDVITQTSSTPNIHYDSWAIPFNSALRDNLVVAAIAEEKTPRFPTKNLAIHTRQDFADGDEGYSLTELETPVIDVLPDTTDIVLTPTRHGKVVAISELEILTTMDESFLMDASAKMGYAAARYEEKSAITALSAATNAFYSSSTGLTSGSADSTLNYESIVGVRRIFGRNNSIPQGTGLVEAIITPETFAALQQDEGWVTPHVSVDTGAYYNGMIGVLGGVKFKVSNLNAPEGATTVSYFYTPGALASYHLIKTQPVYKNAGELVAGDYLNNVTGIGWKGIWDYKINRQTSLIKVTSDSGLSIS